MPDEFFIRNALLKIHIALVLFQMIRKACHTDERRAHMILQPTLYACLQLFPAIMLNGEATSPQPE